MPKLLRAALCALAAVLVHAAPAHADCSWGPPGRKLKLLLHRCGGHGQAICPRHPACVDGASYDAASARCQVKDSCAVTQDGRNDGLCFSLEPCGAGGRRSCANQPFCISPAKYDAAAARCELPEQACLKKRDLPAVGSDFTFLVATDLHFGKEAFSNASHEKHVRIMNRVGAGAVGLVTTGDNTHYGHDHQLAAYRLLFEDHGAKSLKLPVYVGLGNHDLDGDCAFNNCGKRMFAYVKQRMGPGCMDVAGFDEASHSYSWNWGGVHFVQLHKWAGDTTLGHSDKHGDSYAWLKADLAKLSPDAPLILFQHYGFDGWSLNDTKDGWWTNAQAQAFADALEGHKVLGIFVGHNHGGSIYAWTSPKGKAYQIFQGGTGGEGADRDCDIHPEKKPAVTPWANPRGRFFQVHVSGGKIVEAKLWEWTDATGDAPQVIKSYP
jgi:hypothetical protein